MTCRNLTITLEDGRTITWRLPRFSALLIVLRQSASTLMRTIFQQKGQPWQICDRADTARTAHATQRSEMRDENTCEWGWDWDWDRER